MPNPIRRLVHVLASVAVLSLAMVFVQATPASAQGTWGSPMEIDSNTLTSVSCPSSSFCAAVDEVDNIAGASNGGNALTYNGSSWSTPSDIDGSNNLTSVSCPSASFCAAVDAVGNALTYNGSSWSTPSDIDGSDALSSVSCPSAVFCVAVDGEGDALTYNGTSWSVPSDIDGSNKFTSVSCPSAIFCVAVDGDAFTYNGTSWSVSSAVSVAGLVSCASATFCVDVFGGEATTYNGSSWATPSDIDGSNNLTSVSCPSASFCAAVDAVGNALTYNGSSWSTPSDIGGENVIYQPSVSCSSAYFCAAVYNYWSGFLGLFPGDAVLYSSGGPTVTAVTPDAGPTSGGTAITITGTNFTRATLVFVAGVAATDVTVVNSTTVTATTPPDSAGLDYVVVSTPSGPSAKTTGAEFTYETAPSVTGVSPDTGPTSGGTPISITGTNLTGATGVVVAGLAATDVMVVSPTTLTATTPAYPSAGLHYVRVTTPSGESAKTTGAEFTYEAPPTVTSISPTSGPSSGGTDVAITGTNLTGATQVLFGAVAATSFTVVSSTEVTAVSPAQVSGALNVYVTTPGGTSAAAAGDVFTYTEPPPTVTAVSPNAGPASGNTAITITGTNFTEATGVSVAGVAATDVSVVNSTTITATTPAYPSAGLHYVLVSTPYGTSIKTTGAEFTYEIAPTVTAVSPDFGPTTGGTAMTITGINFTGATSVLVAGLAPTDVSVVNSTTITATTPAYPSAGLHYVVVTTPNGTSAKTTGAEFTYEAPPTVTAVSPDFGPTTGGTAITITGTNFTAVTSVLVAGRAPTDVSVVNSTTITATTPAYPSGSLHYVVVSTPYGTSTKTTGAEFTYEGAPTVTSVSPHTGRTSGGTTITITGTSLAGDTLVSVAGVAATDVTVVSPTTVTAKTPPYSAGLHYVRVSTLYGSSTKTTGAEFTYIS